MADPSIRARRPLLIPRIAAAALATALLQLGAGAQFSQGTVHVVDQALGPGSDFADLPEAVAAARSGDLVLVRSGRYSGFTVDHKALRVVADAGADVEIAGVAEVLDLGGAQTVLLRGLRSPATLPFFEVRGVGAIGQLWLEDCQLGPPAGVEAVFARPAMYLKSMTSVAIVNCELTGQDGSPPPFPTQAGAPAVEADFSNVWVYGSTLRGGDAHLGSGAPGGDGLALKNFELFASDSDFAGGSGGDGASCQAGGDGGDAVAALELVTNLHLHQNDYAPGSGGAGGPCGGGLADRGLDGERVATNGGLSEHLDGPARGFTAKSPILDTEPFELTYAAPAGEPVVTVLSIAMDIDVQYALSGVLLTGPELLPIYRGPVPASGELRVPRADALLLPGFDHVAVFIQSLFAPTGASGPVLGPATSVVILDSDH